MFKIASRLFALGALATLALIWVPANPTSAEPLNAPENEVVLVVTGDIEATNDGDAAKFDLDMLRALGPTEVKTSTIWTEGEQTFVGVSLDALMAAVGVDEGVIRASAINDYTVEIPVSDAVEGGPIVAYELNGDTMSVREKGPLWVIYPYDANSDYRSELIYGRSIWQLDRFEIVK